MGRRKIKIAYIEDDRKRATTFEKRRIGLFKKASELNQLCGVNISVIIISRDSLYRFSDVPETFSRENLVENQEKFKEDFTNVSLLEFITKRNQKPINAADSNSIDHHSVCDNPKNDLTDDEEGSPFCKVLGDYQLLDVFNSMKTDISPGLENTDLTVLTTSNNNPKVGETVPTAFNFNTNGQTSKVSSSYSIPSIDQIRIGNPYSFTNESNSYSKSNGPFYSDLVSMSCTEENYSFNTSSLSSMGNHSSLNSGWENHKNHKPQRAELHFNKSFPYVGAKNSLETPIYESCNIDQLQHLNNGLPANFSDLLGCPISKRPKILLDLHDAPMF